MCFVHHHQGKVTNVATSNYPISYLILSKVKCMSKFKHFSIEIDGRKEPIKS